MLLWTTPDILKFQNSLARGTFIYDASNSDGFSVLTSYWKCRGFGACSRTLPLVSLAPAPVPDRSQGSRRTAGAAVTTVLKPHCNSCCLCPIEILLQLFSRNGVRGIRRLRCLSFFTFCYQSLTCMLHVAMIMVHRVTVGMGIGRAGWV